MSRAPTVPVQIVPSPSVLKQMTKASLTAKRVLLVVDDDENVGRALSRLLGRYFDDIHAATNSFEACMLLSERRITHLICDYFLGKDQPLGIELIPKWRSENPSIRRAIIFTGNDLDSIPVTWGVDQIISKSTSPRVLVDILESI